MSSEEANNSEMCSSDDDSICIIGEISSNSSKEYCHSVIALTDSEKEFTMKRRMNEESDSSDSASESNKYLRTKKSRAQFYERGNNNQTDAPEKLFVIDNKGQPLVEDEFRLHEVVNRKEMKGRYTTKEGYPEVNGYVSSKRSRRYPPVPFGMRRLKIRDESLIQTDVEKIKACPGLEHVTEIRGQREISYFCGICNRLYEKKGIISHLKDVQHKVKSLKALNHEWYSELKRIRTPKRKKYLNAMLSNIQGKEGIGKIVVEKDYLDADNYKASQHLDTPSTSSATPSIIYCSNTDSSSLVLSDFSKSDYFCRICECNMFDISLWESHTKNRSMSLRKYPVGKAPKIEVEKIPGTKSFLVASVNIPNNSEPMVGLEYIREFQHFEAKKETYHCLLCGDCLTCLDITQHVTSLSHRINYLESINHYTVEYVTKLLKLNNNQAFHRVEDICRTIESERRTTTDGEGSPPPSVYVIKNLKET